jgi:hypothetical protein
MSYLFIKKSVSKRKVCIIFIRNKKNLKTQKTKKKYFWWVFLGGFFGFFWVGFLLPTLLQGGGDQAGLRRHRVRAGRQVT